MTVELAVTLDGPDGAPPLVLLNSLGTSGEMWNPVLGALAEWFRVVRIDARGHGRSPAAPVGAADAPVTVGDLGGDVIAVLDRLGLDRVHLAGLSLGGMTAMWLAVHHPERVSRLALLCSSAYPGSPDAWNQRARAVRTDGMESIADTVVSRWVTPDLAGRDPGVVASLRGQLTGVDAESYAQCCEAIAGLDVRADLPRIAAPTLVISASGDTALPPEQQEVIARGIVGARLVSIEQCAHIATVEQAGAIAPLLLDHFSAAGTLATGYATRRAVLGDAHVDAAIARTDALTADFQEFLTRYAWGEVWSRPGLGRRDRSIATLAALVALGAEHEIAMHLRAALRNGLSRAEIAEVLQHTALYAGLPRANRAFAIAQETLAETGR